jgi:hypothetical protein
VDVHADAIGSVRRLADRAGYADRFGEIVCSDAIRHRWPVAGRVGVVEVMQRALEKEPQVAVTANLASQLEPDGILIPERIRLEVQLVDAAAEFALDGATLQRVRIPRGTLLELGAATAGSLLKGCALEFAHDDPSGLEAMVSTRIDVFGAERLDDYDSGITMPWIAHALGRSGPGRRARIRLVPGATPRLEAEST